MLLSETAAPSYNPEWQTHLDGSLAPAIKARISALLNSPMRLSFAALCREIGFSSTFIKGLMEDTKNIRTRHMPGFNEALERLEARAGLRPRVTTLHADEKLIELLVVVAGSLTPNDRTELLRRLAAKI